MMLTTKGRYAVTAIIDIASQVDQNKPVRLAEIASRANIDLSYLEQIFAKLKRTGIVTSVRGPGGGYLISEDYNQLSIYRIMHAVEENMEMTQCHSAQKKCNLRVGSKCSTHNLWTELSKKIKSYLSRITIADVLNNKIDHSYATHIF